MKAMIVSDNSKVTSALQSLLQSNGFDCQLDRDVLPVLAVTEGPAKQLAQELIVLVMPFDFRLGIRAVRTLRSSSRGAIVAVGPTDNSKALLTVLREGANDYLDVSELAAELSSTLGRLQLHGDSDIANGRAVALIGACGGAGTSSLSANLAAIFAKRHKQSGLVDLRLGLGDLSMLLDVEPKHSLATVCRNTSRLDQSMFRHSLSSHPSGIQLLAAPNTWDECAQVTAKGVRHAITLARTQFPYVFMDLDSSFTAEQVAAIISSDVILVVVRPDMLSLKNGRRILETLDRLGVSEDRIRLIVNRCGQSGQLPLSKVRQALGISMLQSLVEDEKGMNLASNKGVPIVVERPRSRIAKQIAKLATRLEELPGVYDRSQSMLTDVGDPRANVSQKSNATKRNPVVDGSKTNDLTVKGNGADELDTTSIEFSL